MENAVRRIADEALADLNPSEGDLRTLRNAFVQKMVRLTERGEFSRCAARWADLSPEAYPLLEKLIGVRLLVLRQQKGERTVEVAHEALLRTWPTLKQWLKEGRQELEQQRRVERLCEDLKSSQQTVRLAALRSLEMLAESDPKGVQQAVGPLGEIIGDDQWLPKDWTTALKALEVVGGHKAADALIRFLEREQLQEETDCERVATVLNVLTIASKILLQIQQLLNSSLAGETRLLKVPTATVRADGGAVSTSLVTLPLWRSPSQAGVSSPLRGAAGEKMQVAWFEELSPGVSLTLLEIPAGSFLMGSPPDEPEREYDEGPQHVVTLEGFFLSQTPITQVQWRAVASWPEVQKKLDPDPSNFKGGDRPVEQVSWLDAMEFCSRLSLRSGRRYTLPSEAQWEYACRASTTTPFHFGETITPEMANYELTHLPWSNVEQTSEVGRYPANAWGLQDMHGNIWEWCLDRWHNNYEGAPEDGCAWLDPEEAKGARVVLRGGGWNYAVRGWRSASRISAHPGINDDEVGFRVCCIPQDELLAP